MNITRLQTKNTGIGLVLGALFFLGAFNSAHAQTYYYPVTTYQQPANNAAQIQALLNQIYALVAQVQTLHQQTGNTVYTYTVTPPYTVSPAQPINPYTSVTSYTGYYGQNYSTSVTTGDSQYLDRYSVTLTGNVRLDGASYGHVWFEYGEDGYITDQTSVFNVVSNGEFHIDLTGLSSNTRYYYRAVVEDPSGNRSYGSLESFTTGNYSGSNNNNNNHNYNNEPDVTTDDVQNINSNSAELHGSVSMNDYDNGVVFFVYGQSNSEVQDVENEDRFGSIYEDQQDLQKVQVDSSLDGTKSYWTRQYGLDSNARYYYRVCVGYQDNNSDDTVTCGAVESFRTNS